MIFFLFQEPEISVYDWSEPITREPYQGNGNNRVLSNNNNNWNTNRNRPNNLWTDNDNREERPIWDREITINNNQPSREPGFNRYPSWQENPRVSEEDLIEDRQPATARPQRNPEPLQPNTQLPSNSIILRRKVGLKSLESKSNYLSFTHK